MVYEGITDQSAALLVGGAVCITLGLITSVYAIRSTFVVPANVAPVSVR